MSSITKSVYPLANPKGIKNTCELCGKPAFLQCNKCKITYYCSHEHQRMDWVAIHEKICPYVAELKTTGLPFLGSEDERQRRNADRIEKQRNLIMLTRTTGQKFLFEKRYNEAVPAALQSLKYSIEVHGTSSIELVISYLILAEASIGLEKLNQAEQYLSQAEWTVLKTESVGNDYKAKLYTNMGLLYDAKKSYQEALRNFANGIYYASEEYGTDDIRTSSAYFYMANVFYKQNRPQVTASMYKQVTDIWQQKLENLCAMKLSRPSATAEQRRAILGKTRVTSDENTSKHGDLDLDIAQQAEARQVLSSILDYWNGEGIDGATADQQASHSPAGEVEGCDGTTMANLLLTLAYLEFYLDNTPRSLELLSNARDALNSADTLGLDGEELMETIEVVNSQISAVHMASTAPPHLRSNIS
ncbi:zinc finger MYND domain-containing protein 12-like [Convolutriloba macropyga]|uniref:zinc finger MYND domain-containing protein 12-like n=1 Tax=Convolutriloba macropyga TaxID=536237 RepID=UPI003F51E392